MWIIYCKNSDFKFSEKSEIWVVNEIIIFILAYY